MLLLIGAAALITLSQFMLVWMYFSFQGQFDLMNERLSRMHNDLKRHTRPV